MLISVALADPLTYYLSATMLSVVLVHVSGSIVNHGYHLIF